MPPMLMMLTRLQSMRSARQLGNPRLLRGIVPLPALGVSITGVSRDSAGVALGSCVCSLFRVTEAGSMPTFTHVATTISDGSGNYSFVVGFDGPYRVTFDIAGPTRAGLTDKTLSGI